MTKPQAQFNVLDCDVPLYTVTLWRKSDLTEILGDAFVTSKRLIAGNFGTSVGVDRRYSSPIRKKSGEINFGKLSKPSPPVIYANAAKQSSSSSSVVSAAAAAGAAAAASMVCLSVAAAAVNLLP